MSGAKEKGPEWYRWLRANGHNVAALTGTDVKTLGAIAGCWQLYSYERSARTPHAVAFLVVSMQPKTRPLARELIAWAMDWNDREPVWRAVELALSNHGLGAV